MNHRSEGRIPGLMPRDEGVSTYKSSGIGVNGGFKVFHTFPVKVTSTTMDSPER